MSIEANIAGRKAAEQVFDLINGELRILLDKFGQEALQAFFGTLREAYGDNLTVYKEPPSAKPMSDQDADEFGATRMPWGRYNGDQIRDVPLEYLDWLLNQPDEFKDKVNRYLLNARVARSEREERAEAF